MNRYPRLSDGEVTVLDDAINEISFRQVMHQRKNFSIRRHAGIWHLKIGTHIGTGRTLGEALRAVPAE